MRQRPHNNLQNFFCAPRFWWDFIYTSNSIAAQGNVLFVINGSSASHRTVYVWNLCCVCLRMRKQKKKSMEGGTDLKCIVISTGSHFSHPSALIHESEEVPLRKVMRVSCVVSFTLTKWSSFYGLELSRANNVNKRYPDKEQHWKMMQERCVVHCLSSLEMNLTLKPGRGRLTLNYYSYESY